MVADNIHCPQKFCTYAVGGYFQTISTEEEVQKKLDICDLKNELGGEKLEGMKGKQCFDSLFKEFHREQYKRGRNSS